MTRLRTPVSVVVAVLALPLAACTGPTQAASSRDLCAAYARAFAQVQDLKPVQDVAGAKALRDQVTALQKRLDRIEAASDDGWGPYLQDAREKAQDLGSSATTASAAAEHASRKSISDGLKDLRISVARLQADVATECG